MENVTDKESGDIDSSSDSVSPCHTHHFYSQKYFSHKMRCGTKDLQAPFNPAVQKSGFRVRHSKVQIQHLYEFYKLLNL